MPIVAWLIRDGEVLATAELAETRRARRRGLLGRSGISGALLLRPARAVHTLGMRFAIDVAYCDSELRVVSIRCMKPWRVGAPRIRCRMVIEAEAGAFERWGLWPGDTVEIKGD